MRLKSCLYAEYFKINLISVILIALSMSKQNPSYDSMYNLPI